MIVRGTGSWADILAQHRATFHPTRSSVDLKDKWRNLVKVGTSDGLPLAFLAAAGFPIGTRSVAPGGPAGVPRRKLCL